MGVLVAQTVRPLQAVRHHQRLVVQDLCRGPIRHDQPTIENDHP